MTIAADAKNSAIDLPIFIPKGDQKPTFVHAETAHRWVGF